MHTLLCHPPQSSAQASTATRHHEATQACGVTVSWPHLLAGEGQLVTVPTIAQVAARGHPLGTDLAGARLP